MDSNKQIYVLKNLCCANCASKIENKIRKIKTIEKANLVFTSKKLYVEGKLNEHLIDEIQFICDLIEEGIIVSREDLKTYTYSTENLCCANCAAKIEKKLNQMEGIENAVLTLTTNTLKIQSIKKPSLLVMNEIADSIEKGTIIKEKTNQVNEVPKNNKHLYEVIAGATIFILALILKYSISSDTLSFILFVLSYLVLGYQVLLTAFNNIRKGQIFDENFLMSIATLGAMLIAEYSEAVGVMLFFRIGELFEHHALERSRTQIMNTINLKEDITCVKRNGIWCDVATEEVVEGETILVKVGEHIPLDCTVIEGDSFVDTSTINGEVVPIHVNPNDQVVSGYLNTTAVLTLRVDKVLSESMVSKILDAVENAQSNKPKLEKFITKFARVYTPIVVFIALFTGFVMPLLLNEAFYPWIYTALSFLVMSCPCALILSVPLAYFCGMGALSKRKILCKGGLVLERLANIKMIIMDKTGTISKGEFIVQKVEVYNQYNEEELLSYIYELESNSNHPIAKSIIKYCEDKSVQPLAVSQIVEVTGKGMKAMINDKELLVGNRKMMNTYHLDHIVHTGHMSEVFIAYNNELIGCVLIADTIKKEAKHTIDEIHKQGIKTAMLTGDRKESANYIGKETNIQIVVSDLLPEEKYNKMEELRETYGEVLFVGDGINDSIVLAGANVGAAMGSGSDAAIDIADIVFMNSNLDAINESIKISKNTIAIAKQNVIGALTIKGIVMILGLTGLYANMWLAVFADTGVAMICILNAMRIFYRN